MTELEKLDAGLEYSVLDPEVDARKKNAVIGCARLAAIDPTDYEAQYAAIRELFGTAGKVANVLPGFRCDYGKNIHVGEDFLANYNVTILDIAPVRIGDYCMIGPNTLITTVERQAGEKSLWEAGCDWRRCVDWWELYHFAWCYHRE